MTLEDVLKKMKRRSHAPALIERVVVVRASLPFMAELLALASQTDSVLRKRRLDILGMKRQIAAQMKAQTQEVPDATTT